jgi:hypothetical protein
MRALETRLASSTPRELTQNGQARSSPPLLRELFEDRRQRWAAFAGDPDRDFGSREPDSLLCEEHRDLLALVERGAGDEEGDGDALGVFEAGCEVDDDLLSCHVDLLSLGISV